MIPLLTQVPPWNRRSSTAMTKARSHWSANLRGKKNVTLNASCEILVCRRRRTSTSTRPAVTPHTARGAKRVLRVAELAPPHQRGAGQDSKAPLLAFDCLFTTAGGVKLKDELTEEDEVLVKVLVAKDQKSTSVVAHLVERTGLAEDNCPVDVLVEDLKWLGHSHVVLRTDNEPAIVALLKQAMITLRQESPEVKQIVEEHSSRYVSQSNGFIEVALRDIQGLLRTYMCALEQRIGQRIPPDHAVFSWMVEHAAWILTTRRVGHDARTGYGKVRRHDFSKRSIEFGEKVLYKLPMKGPEADARGSMDPKWKFGIVLGFSKNSPDY